MIAPIGYARAYILLACWLFLAGPNAQAIPLELRASTAPSIPWQRLDIPRAPPGNADYAKHVLNSPIGSDLAGEQERTWISVQKGPIGLDLWQIAADLKAPPGSSIAISFEIERSAPGPVYLLLGCGGQALVSVNRQPVYALVRGNRSLLRNQDVVELPLLAGRNTVEVVFDRESWTSIPADHYAPEWSATLELVEDAESAWSAHCAEIIHPIVDPIVADYDALRVEAVVPGHNVVQLFDLQGTLRASGMALSDLTIRWDDPTALPPRPFAGMLVIGNKVGETVLVTGSATIDEACAATAAMRATIDPSDGWYLRLKYMLGISAPRDRGLGWRRNLALVLAMSVAEREKPEVAAVLKHCKPARVECRSYVSAIDGTTQYYLLYRCEQPENAPLTVIFPAVPARVRPFLETGAVINQRGYETMASVAARHGVNVVWPGVVDVDYGGHLMRRGVRECVDAAVQELGSEWRGGIYGVGQCSSGVGVLGYAQDTHPLHGIVLHNPIVQRMSYRWLPNLPQFPTGFTRVVGEREQVGPGLRDLPRLPVQLMYDIDQPGHGDREGSLALEAELRKHGYTVESHWPEPLKAMPWGERAKAVADRWFIWIKQQERNRDVAAAARIHPQQRKIATVKEALLEGFTTADTTDPAMRRWLWGWFGRHAQYRGAIPDLHRRAPTQVDLRVLDAEEREPRRLLSRFSGAAESAKTGIAVEPFIRQADALFGFRLDATAAEGNRVEVFRAGEGNEDLPSCDLLLDGCCRGALWALQGDRWTLVDVWL